MRRSTGKINPIKPKAGTARGKTLKPASHISVVQLSSDSEESDEASVPNPKSCLKNSRSPIQISDETSSDSTGESDESSQPHGSAIQSTLYKTMYPNGPSHSYFPTSNEVEKENDSNAINKETPPVHLQMNKNDDIEKVYEQTFGKSDSIANVKSKPSEIGILKTQRHETVLPDGRKEVRYSNGNVKTVSPNGNLIKLVYYNGDIKETDFNSGTVKYFYSETKTWHTQYKDGLEILEFGSGQVEKHFKDGSIIVEFPNGSVQSTDAHGNQKWQYHDGTVVNKTKNGDKVINLPNGQKEIHTSDHKRRIYPDGTVKLLYPNGTTETRYSSGRIRMKDKFGNLILDSDHN